MIYFYLGLFAIGLFFLIETAVEMGVRSALTSSKVNESLSNAVRDAVRQTLNLHEREQEFPEQND